MFALLFFINIAFALPNHYSLEQDRHLNSRKVYLTPKQTHKKLTRAHKLMSDKSTVDQAIKYLKDLEHKVSQRPYELALVKQNLGYAYVNKNEMNKALKIFDEALALKVLPSAVTKTLMYNAARILTSLNQFDEAQKRLQEWFAVTEKPAAQAYVLMARILFEKKQKKKLWNM